MRRAEAGVARRDDQQFHQMVVGRNDVDWTMKTSEPRTFPGSRRRFHVAKRRTTALVSCSRAPWRFPAPRRIGVAGDELDRAVLGRHRGFSSRLAGDNVQHIAIPTEPARFDERGDIKEERGWQPWNRFSCVNQCPRRPMLVVNGRYSRARRLERAGDGRCASMLATAGRAARCTGAGAVGRFR